jgi:transcriptional regulator with XRE-family HTH domain
MDSSEIRALRTSLHLTQRQLAEALGLDVDLVRQWEKAERFPTRTHVQALEALRARPPAAPPPSPLALLGDPGFLALLRKLLAHARLRDEVGKLAAEYPDPLEEP